MKTIFHVQWFNRGEWRKTYFGNNIDPISKLFYFDLFEDAKKDIHEMHERQKERGRKKLTKYRIVEKIYHEIIHEIP